MFYNCSNLKTIYASALFRTSNVYTYYTESYSYAFTNDTKLV